MDFALKLVRDEKDEVPISALIVKDDKLISQAVNSMESQSDPTCHAEMMAIKEACKVIGDWRLNDCTLYTTLEPCCMCTGAIINSRIKKVVFAAYDKDFVACGSAVNIISALSKENQIEVLGGISEVKASTILKEFFKSKRKNSIQD